MSELDQEIFDGGSDLAIHYKIVDEVNAEIQLIGLHDVQEEVQLRIAEKPVPYQGVHQAAVLTALAAVATTLPRELLEQREQLGFLHLVRLVEADLVAQQPDHLQHLLVPELSDS